MNQIRKFTLFGQFDFYVTGRIYPTMLAAKGAWEDMECRSRGGQISVWRLQDQSSGKHVVVALSELEEPVQRALRRLARSGDDWSVPNAVVERLALRRARVTTAGPEGDYVDQRARYGEGGAIIDSRGRVTLRRRPQG